MSTTLKFLFLSRFLWGCGVGLYTYLWPIYIQALGADGRVMAFIFGFEAFLTTITAIPGGLWADRFERKKLLLIAWIIGSSATLVYATATNWQQLVVGDILYFGAFFCNPITNSYIAKAAEGNKLSSTFSISNSAPSMGLIISPSVGGIIADKLGMAAVFYMSFVLFMASTVALTFITPQYPTVEPGSKGTGYLGVLDGLLSRKVGWFALATFALTLSQPYLTPFVKIYANLSLTWVGILGSVLSLGGVTLTHVLGRLSDRVGEDAGYFIGLLLFTVATFPIMIANRLGIPWLAAIFFLRGAFVACQGVMFSSVAKSLRPEANGKGFAILNFSLGVSTIGGYYFGGRLFLMVPDKLFAVSGILVALVAFRFFRLAGFPPRKAGRFTLRSHG